MRWGSPWSAGWGNPENHFVYCIPDTAAMQASGYTFAPFRFKLRPRLDGAYVSLYRNGSFIKNVYGNVGQEVNAIVDVPWGGQSVSVLPLRIGHLGDGAYSDEKVAKVFEAVENSRVTLAFTFTPEIVSPALSDGGFTSNWSLTGLQRGMNTALVQGHPAWGRLGLQLLVSGGDCTVVLTRSGTLVASGSAAIGGSPFSVALSQKNNSGLAGSVTISNSLTNITNGVLDVCWPAAMQILRDTFDPPTTVRDSIAFSGVNSIRWTEPSELPAGTYYYRTQPLSDTGVAGTQSASVSIAPVVRPKPPTNLAYLSGNAAATVLTFTPSVTANATYRAYLATTIGAVMNLNDIQATAGIGAASITLPAISGYPGVAYVIVRAVVSGIEERNLNTLKLEYDATGNFIAPRPNAPGIQLETIAFATGRSMQVTGLLNTDHQAAAASSLQLFTRTPSGNYNYAIPAATVALQNGAIPGVKSAMLSYTFPSDGYYYIIVLSVTAGGIQSDPASAVEVLIRANTDTLPAATNVTAQLTRS